jgi:tRNA A-37 threonylcarbamoyl transferase component Bud32
MDEQKRILRTREAGGLIWTYREGYEDLTAVDFNRQMRAGASENRVRIRGRLETGGHTYFVKIFKHVDFGRALKSRLFGHDAKREFITSDYLASLGIRTPEALAVGLSREMPDHAIIVFREITGAVSLKDLVMKARPNQRDKYLDLIAQTTAALHRVSFYHRDYHAGNLLLTTDATGKPHVWVIDLHRSSFPRDMLGFRGPKNIADIIHSLLPAVGQGDIRRFLSRYRKENPAARWDETAAERSIEKRLKKIETRRLRSRTKRCMINSSVFSVTRSLNEVVYARRDFSPEEIARVIGRFALGEGRLIKKDKKASIALVSENRGDLCVKAYERLGFSGLFKALMGISRGHNSWRAAQGLSVRGFNTPRHLCLVIKRRLFVPRAIYLVMESIAPRLEMARFILRNLKDRPSGTAARFVTSFGSVIGSLHRAGIYHRDLKTSNIAVERQGDTFSISFLDLDAVSFGRSVSRTRRAKNLAQIYLSTPGLIGAEQRKLFFEAYAATLAKEEEFQAIARLVGNLVKGKDIRYASDHGDVIEDARDLYSKLWGDD